MARDNEVRVNIVGDADSAVRALRTVGDEADKTESRFSAIGSKMQSVGKKMSAAVTLPIVGIAAVSFKAASDTNESMSKVNVVFGDSAKVIEEFSKSAAKNLGISRQEALEAAGTFGNLFKALGVGSEPAAKLSTSLTGLSSDLASFNNANPTEVLEALRSGLLGEAEPLRKFGVSLSAARIEATALSMGLAKGNVDMLKVKTATAALDSAMKNAASAVKEFGAESAQAAQANLAVEVAEHKVAKAMEGNKAVVSDAAKAQAAYAIIMKDTTLAQGDFERTSDGAANQQRILMAQFKDTAAVLGQQLLPIGTQIIGWVSGLAEKFGSLSPTVQKFVLIGAGLVALLGPVITLIGSLSVAMGFLAANPIVLVVVAIAALVAGIIWAYKNVSWFRDGVQSAFGAIAAAGQWIGRVFAGVWDGIVAGFVWVRDTLRSIANWLISNVVNKFVDGVNMLIKAANFINPGKDTALIPRIPMLAKGGIVTGPTLAMIGEAGPEAVIPLSRAGGMGMGGSNVTINFNGVTTREAADQVVKVLELHFGRGGALSNGRGGTLAPA